MPAATDVEVGTSFIIAHAGDYYKACESYAKAMETRGVAAAGIPADCYESRWESWGYEFAFTAQNILDKLDELQALHKCALT